MSGTQQVGAPTAQTPNLSLTFAAIRSADALRECGDDASLVSTGPGSQAGRVINYEQRPRHRALEHAGYLGYGKGMFS